jgi:hypothetical protein
MPQRATCLLRRQWRQERSCVKRCLPEQMPEASQRMLHQEDGFCVWEAAQRGVLRGSATFPCCPECRRLTFVHPLFASPSLLAPVRGPGASHVCCSLLWYTVGVPLAPEHTTDPCRPLPAYADAACSTGHVGAPCSHVPLSGDAQHGAHAEPPQTTRCNHARCDGAVPPARPAGARLPKPRAGSTSEDQLRHEGGQAETKASDGQGQRRSDHLGVRKWRHVPGRQADHLYQSRVFQAGCVPGATDGAMPVGSVEIIYVFF